MTLNEIAIVSGGSLTILIAVFHTRFYSIFEWERDFEVVSNRNSKIYYTIHLGLLFLFAGIGSISILYSKILSQCTGISFGLVFLLSLFWLWRTLWQIYYFQLKDKRKKMPAIHYALTVIFGLTFLSYTIPLVSKCL